MRRIPIRLRLTLAVATGMAVVLAGLGLLLHVRLQADLTRAIDMELRSRAQVVTAGMRRNDPSVIAAGGNLIDPDEAFAQVLSAAGAIVDTSPGVAGAPMVPPAVLRSAVRSPVSLTARVRGVDDPARLLVVPIRTAGGSLFLVLGSTLGDRNEAVARLTLLLAVLGPIALIVVSAGGWLVAGAALRPVDRMRMEADAVSESELDRRLPVPEADDELSRLAVSLNALLGRLQEAFRREGRFLDQASHELRTPLAVLKMELDLAAAREGDPEQLREALVNASREADRLVRLAEDLLVLARIQGGRLPVRRVPTSLSELVDGVCTARRAAAGAVGSRLVCTAMADVVPVDASRVRQALEDLLDNALRHGAGGPIEVSAEWDADLVRISVRDHGSGFDPEVLPIAGDAFVHGAPDQREVPEGGGLGLAIVRAVAEAHGGHMELQNAPQGGAVASFTLRAAAWSGNLASIPGHPHVE